MKVGERMNDRPESVANFLRIVIDRLTKDFVNRQWKGMSVFAHVPRGNGHKAAWLLTKPTNLRRGCKWRISRMSRE